jgi:hypothetical protein
MSGPADGESTLPIDTEESKKKTGQEETFPAHHTT